MAPKSELQRFTLDNNKNFTAVLDKHRGLGRFTMFECKKAKIVLRCINEYS